MTATGAIGTAMMRSSRCQPTKKEEYDIGVLLVVFGVFLYVAGRITSRLVRVSGRQAGESHDPALFDEAVAEIRSRLERGETPPLCEAAPTAIRVFVSGHTHAPSLTHFGNGSALINSGCWLRQLQRFVLTLARHRCSSLASCRPTYVSTGRRLALRSSSGNIRVRPSSAFWESNASRWRAASPRNQTILHRACGSGRRFRSSRKAYCVQ